MKNIKGFSLRLMLVQFTDISVGLMSARDMPLQAKRLISVGGKCIRLNWFCQAVVSYAILLML